jgi:tetratricopeptide (TPR) repeat protein
MPCRSLREITVNVRAAVSHCSWCSGGHGMHIGSPLKKMMLPGKQHISLLSRMRAVCIACIVLVSAGAAFSRNSIWQDPVSLWEDAARKNPREGRIFNNLGEAYHKKKQLGKALENYYRAIQLSPFSSLDAYGNIGSIYADLGDYAKAIQIYSQLLLIDQNDPVTYASRGHVFYLQGQQENAIQDFSRSLLLSPYTAAVYVYRGKSYEKLGKRSAALEDYRAACSLGETSACKLLPIQ